jgi:hypothetical protein
MSLGPILFRGRSIFADRSLRHAEITAKVYVKVRFGGLSQALLAQLDTGAAWSVLAPDVATAARISVASGDPAKLSTRFGIKDGYLVRVPLTFEADAGVPLVTEATFFVAADWPEGMTFLGYSGLLDSMRFALDPQANHFYFGA